MNKNKWRLTPREDDLYDLEKYHPDIDMWLSEVVKVKEENVDKIIKNLERDIIPIRK